MSSEAAKDEPRIDVPFEGEELPDRGKTVNIVTTEVGVLQSMGGIAKIGTRDTVPLEAFSRNWMKPADGDSAKAINAYLKKVDAEKAEAKAKAKTK